MKRKFIIDQEIDLLENNNSQANNDMLNTKVYADTLKKAILNAPTDKGFTIGLFGEWGSGKSSIIKTVDKQIVKEESDKGRKVKMITYDAWKYANDSFRRMFLLNMQKQLNFEQSEFMTLFYNNKSEETEIKYKVNFKKLFWLILVFCILVFIIYITPTVNSDLKILLWLMSTVFSLLSQFIKKLKVFDELKVLVQSPLLFAPEQFEACFDEMIEKSIKKYNWLEKKVCFFKGENYEKDIDKLIIVIDNIDRCHKELAYELLTNIKNFLGDNGSIVFVIPVDDKALRRHISNTNNKLENCDKEAEEFLRKFFNVTIRIKPFGSDEMYDFSAQLINKYNLGFNPSTISLVSNEFASNPRRIIQIFNNLSSELESLPTDISSSYESVVCKILIIREEYSDFYELLVKKPEIIFQNEIEDKCVSKNEKLKIFLKNTFAVTNSLKNDVEKIERILSNSVVFDGIQQTIKSAIKKSDSNALIEHLKETPTKKERIVNYIFTLLKTAIRRRTFDTDIINLMNLIMELSYADLLSTNNLLDLHDIINSEELLRQVLVNLNDYEKFIQLSHKFDNIGLSRISDYIVSHLNQRAVSDEDILNDEKDIQGVFQACSILSVKHVTSLMYSFLRIYKLESSGLQKHLYEDKYDILLNTDFVKYVIDQLSFDLHNNYYEDFVYLIQKTNIKTESLNYLLNKFNSIIPEIKTNTDNSTVISTLFIPLNKILSVLNEINLSEEKEELVLLLSKLENTHNVRNPNNTLTKFGYIAESIIKTEESKLIIDFLFHIALISRETINITPALNNYVELYQNYINEWMNKLLSLGFKLDRLHGIILKNEDYTDNSFILLKHSFLVKLEDGNYTVPNEEVANKLNIILNHIFEDVKRNELIQFIENIIDEERIGRNMTVLLTSVSKENLLKLSDKIKKLAINTFVNNLSDYESNNNVLTLIGTLGNQAQISKLIPVINKKLMSQTTLDEGLELVRSLNSIKIKEAESLKSNIKLSEESIDKEVFKQITIHIESITKSK